MIYCIYGVRNMYFLSCLFQTEIVFLSVFVFCRVTVNSAHVAL